MEKFTLKKPIEFEEETYNELELDFDSLTGDDILAAEGQYLAENGSANGFMKETSKAYQVYVAARAAKVRPELIRALKAGDFTRLTVRTQSFLLITG